MSDLGDTRIVWRVTPRGPLRGTLQVPGDKSISHRSLMLNALASAPARVRGLLQSEDVAATRGALQALGVGFQDDGDALIVRPPPAGLAEPDDVIDCGNSGTSIRLLAGLVTRVTGTVVLTGDRSLRSRPMGRVVRPLRAMGARILGRQGAERAPLVVVGGQQMRTSELELDVASAQVKSACLLAGLRTGIGLKEPGPSRDHTERMLVAMGCGFVGSPRPGFKVLLPPDSLDPLDVDVPGDLSSALFWLVAASIVEGSEITLPDVGVNPTRTGALDVLEAMGADVQVYPRNLAGAEPAAALVARHGPLVGTTVRGTVSLRAIDELPILAVAAAFAEGETLIADAAELRVKESDRIQRTVAGLRALGVQVEERPDGMLIQGGQPRGPAEIDASGDHRIAMAFAVAGLAAPGGVIIEGAESVRSSYPDFAAHLEMLCPQ